MSFGRWSDAVKVRKVVLRIEGVLGAVIGYGFLAAFLGLISLQAYRWFREGEWPHVGIIDGLRATLSYVGAPDAAGGRATVLLHWLDAPIDWLGLHKVLEALPASLALFAISIFGNFLFIYATDRLREMPRADI